ncbi:MAG: ATP--guanido phosphotransferase [Candidatus Eisenbacteria bacterium]|uniref:ATP--guanido phosphotransferase n=1 Tax=Eiseniibacteriota bacterium TaxID=2212470 RepID=A0A937XAC3_UNCEI|nr:ATP--guanido phosphotransferase [Candidatus Eisenbacteria bacterium]
MTSPAAEMLAARGQWFAAPGPLGEAILSTRVRLARNVRGLRFPPRALPEELEGVLHRVEAAAGQVPMLRGGRFLAMERLSALERQFLLERHLASHDLASDGARRGLCCSADESAALLVNEEDHLRIQALRAGFQLDACFAAATALEDQLESHLEYAFADDFGYLTACPTNVGTGLRASVLIHLPALVLTRRIKKVLSGVAQVGLAVRGFYGEGTDVLGHFFQISNQITLGEKEAQTLLNLERVVHQLLEQEARAREVLLKDAGDQIEDKVRRAHGTLTQAHLLSAEEAIGLASALRLGLTLELEGLPSVSAINDILLHAQPAHLQLRVGQVMDAPARQRARARLVRERLGQSRAA